MTRSTRGGLRNRVRYHFDNLLSRGTWAVLLFLGAVTLAALVVSSGILAVAGVTFADSEGSSLLEDFWQSMLRVIDPGTMAADVGWGPRLLALLVTIFGILIAGTLIGLIASGVEHRVEEMQRGRSVVVESGHVLILGASPRLPVMVNQLTLASRKRRGNAIVVLADREPRELREDVSSLLTDTRGSRLVFRWGDPTRRTDLGIVSIERARAVIVLADDDATSDAGVVKATLAVRAELGGLDRVPVLSELTDVKNAESLAAACGGRIDAIVPLNGIARITAFTLGEPGLNQVIEELLDFRGCDIYLRAPGDLVGASFADSVYRYAKACPIGVMGRSGEVRLNPAPQTVLAGHDRLILISDDDAQVLEPRRSPRHATAPSGPRSPLDGGLRVEHLLVVGWNTLGAELLHQLSDVVAPGSSVEVVYDARLFAPDELDLPATGDLTVKLTPSTADIWHPPAGLELSRTTSIMFLGYRRGTTVEEADSRTLLNVMLLKRELEGRPDEAPRLIVELLNADNVELARMTGVDDFLVSDAIASRLMAQLADQPARRDVLMGLYAPGGPSVRLVEAEQLGVLGLHSWEEVNDTVYACGLLAVGWRRATTRGGGLTMNPHASETLTLEADDHVVVIG